MTTPLTGLAHASRALLRTPLPPCGGVVFFHLPKAAGSTLECFLGAQPEFACCYRLTCGLCKHWGGIGRHGSDGQCEHRERLPEWPWGSAWGGSKERGHFVLPDDLFRIPPNEANTSGVPILQTLRFSTTAHLGPLSVTPGMKTSGKGMMAKFSFLRDAVFPGHGCRLTLVVMLRHPIATLLSAYSYARPKERFLVWAQRHAAVPLGVSSHLFLDGVGAMGGPRSKYGNAFDAHVSGLAARFPSAALDPLLSLLDVVGHVERFTASLLLLIDAAGLQTPLACSAPRNVQQERRCESSEAANRSPTSTEHCYNSSIQSARWREAAAAMPALVAWYDQRLATFDAAIASRGTTFHKRMEQLRDLRAAAAQGARSNPPRHLASRVFMPDQRAPRRAVSER